MTDASKNPAGVPLTLVAAPSPTGGEITIDWSGVPAGIDGKEYSADEIVAMEAPARQQLFEALLAKYDGVSIDDGDGTRVFNTEMDMTPVDDAVYQRLKQLGAVVPPAPAPVAANVDTAPVTDATPPAPPITLNDVVAVPTAQPAAMTQKSAPDTHVTVHNDSVSLLHRAWADVVAGVKDAESFFEIALHHVFPRAR